MATCRHEGGRHTDSMNGARELSGRPAPHRAAPKWHMTLPTAYLARQSRRSCAASGLEVTPGIKRRQGGGKHGRGDEQQRPAAQGKFPQRGEGEQRRTDAQRAVRGKSQPVQPAECCRPAPYNQTLVPHALHRDLQFGQAAGRAADCQCGWQLRCNLCLLLAGRSRAASCAVAA